MAQRHDIFHVDLDTVLLPCRQTPTSRLARLSESLQACPCQTIMTSFVGEGPLAALFVLLRAKNARPLLQRFLQGTGLTARLLDYLIDNSRCNKQVMVASARQNALQPACVSGDQIRKWHDCSRSQSRGASHDARHADRGCCNSSCGRSKKFPPRPIRDLCVDSLTNLSLPPPSEPLVWLLSRFVRAKLWSGVSSSAEQEGKRR